MIESHKTWKYGVSYQSS